MLNLETVYVPEGTYKAYVEAYKDNIPEWVRLKEIGSGDFLISDGELISYSGNDKEVTVPEGVTGIVSYASSFDGETRKLSVRAVIGTDYGETTIQEVF